MMMPFVWTSRARTTSTRRRTIGNIVQSVRMPDGNIKVLVEGVERARSIEVNDEDGFFVATVRTGKTQLEMTPQVEQLMHRVHTLFEQYKSCSSR
jgi:ATP-dependent Lon protease